MRLMQLKPVYTSSLWKSFPILYFTLGESTYHLYIEYFWPTNVLNIITIYLFENSLLKLAEMSI